MCEAQYCLFTAENACQLLRPKHATSLATMRVMQLFCCDFLFVKQFWLQCILQYGAKESALLMLTMCDAQADSHAAYHEVHLLAELFKAHLLCAAVVNFF